jgi:hypothetical protein
MASEKQIAANRRNASLPRGPMTEAARENTRENSIKHGLTARHIVLKHEDQTEYANLLQSITEEYQPHTPQEHRLADQIAQNYWRLLRCRRVETGTFDNRLDTLKRTLRIDPKAAIDNDQGLGICMSNHAHDFDTLRRYETSIERAWYRAIRELKACQKERLRQSAPPEIGCVSQKTVATSAAAQTLTPSQPAPTMKQWDLTSTTSPRANFHKKPAPSLE